MQRPVARSLATALLVDKGNHRHFMAKEIHEQPEVVGHTLASTVDLSLARVEPPKLPFDFAKLNRLAISACGTAFYAGLVAKYWFERWAHLPVDVDIASEMRYRQGGLEPRRRRSLHLAVRRDGRHARHAAALPRAGPERSLHRQCA